MSAETADNAGTPQSKRFHMVNIKMVFYHPKKYKELHGLTSLKCNTRQRSLGGLPVNGALNSDQVISSEVRDGARERAPGPGLKQQASSAKLRYTPTGILLGVDLGPRPQAASDKLSNLQALIKFQATSIRGLNANKTILRMTYMEGNLVW